MFTGTYAALMAEYNAWMNERMYAAAATLSDEDRKRDRGVFFKSIHGTLNHLVWGDRGWVGRLSERSYPFVPPGQDLFADFGELRAARAALDGDILTWSRAVTPEWLAEPMTWTSRLYGFTQTHPRWVQVVQMFNHQTHHRGQVHALLTSFGVDMCPTDVPVTPILNGP